MTDMAMSLKMARWIDQMAAAADDAARKVWMGKADELVTLPTGTETPGVQHDDGITAIPAIDLLRALVDDYEAERDTPIEELDTYVGSIIPPEGIR